MPLTRKRAPYGDKKMLFVNGPREVSAICADGYIAVLPGGVYVCSPVHLSTIRGRASILSCLIRYPNVAYGPTAAWVYLGGRAPRDLHVVFAGNKINAHNPDNEKLYFTSYSEGELLTIENLNIPIPSRVGLDLLYCDPENPDYGLLSGLADMCGGYCEILRHLRLRSRAPGTRKVRWILCGLGEQNEGTFAVEDALYEADIVRKTLRLSSDRFPTFIPGLEEDID